MNLILRIMQDRHEVAKSYGNEYFYGFPPEINISGAFPPESISEIITYLGVNSM